MATVLIVTLRTITTYLVFCIYLITKTIENIICEKYMQSEKYMFAATQLQKLNRQTENCLRKNKHSKNIYIYLYVTL